MKDEAFLQQEIINGATINPGDIRCPGCKGNTYVLSGQIQMPQREIWEDGVATLCKTKAELGGSFDVERLDCPRCRMTFVIRNPDLFRLEAENHSLKAKIDKLEDELENCTGTLSSTVRSRPA
jgi:hypothetical protein